MVNLKSSPWPKYTQLGTIFQKKKHVLLSNFFLLQICSSLDCSQQIRAKKTGGHLACLREKENSFRYRAYFEGNLLRFARARAYVRALMTRKSCGVGMRNAQCNTKELPMEMGIFGFPPKETGAKSVTMATT